MNVNQRQMGGQTTLPKKEPFEKHKREVLRQEVSKAFNKPNAVLEAANIESGLRITSQLIKFIDNQKMRIQLPILLGPPGTGKTFTLENVVPYVIKQTFVKSKPLSEKEANEVKKDIVDMLGENTKKKALNRILAGIEITEELRDIIKATKRRWELLKNEDENLDEKIKLEHMLKQYLNYLRVSRIKENNIKNVITYKVVMPSQEVVTEFITNEEFIVSPKEILKKEISSKLIKMIKEASDGNVVLLVLDELSELLKTDPERSSKGLHPFLDSYLNRRPYKLDVREEQLREGDRENLKELERKGYVKWIGKSTLEITLPSTLIIAATGNIREGEDELVGFTDATEERLDVFNVDYAPPNLVELYVKNIIDRTAESLKEAEVSVDNRTKKNIYNAIIDAYSALYEKYKNKDPSIRSLPSLRSIFGAVKILLMYEIIHKEINKALAEGSNKLSVNGVEEEIIDNNISFNRKETPFINSRAFINYISALLKAQAAYKLGSINIPSETDGYKVMERELDEVYKAVFATLKSGTSQINTSILINMEITNTHGEKRKYTLPLPYYIYLLTTIIGIASRQKFFLYIGTTQEGKTTLASEMVPSVISTLIEKGKSGEYKNIQKFFPYKEVKTIEIENPVENMQLHSTGLKSESKGERKEVGNEPQLLRLLREAQENPNTLYLLVVNEIDRLELTQHLNELMTSDELHLGNEVFDTSNVIIIGTTNVSEQFVDNFMSRAIMAMYFSEGVSEMFVGRTRNTYYVYDRLKLITKKMLEQLGMDKKEIDETAEGIMYNIMNENKDIIEEIESVPFKRLHNNTSDILSPNPIKVKSKEEIEEEITLLLDMIHDAISEMGVKQK